MNINKEVEIQKILRGKYLQGPKFDMSNELIGINYFSGSLESAYYELYGNSSIFRIVVMEPSVNLFTTHYVGKNHLLFLLLEEELLHGGFISLNESILEQFKVILPHIREEQIEELNYLWGNFAYKHYQDIKNEEI